MKRRELIALGGAAVATWPHARSNWQARLGYVGQAWANVRAQVQPEQRAYGRDGLARTS